MTNVSRHPDAGGEDGGAVTTTVVAYSDDEAGESRAEERISDAADIEPDLDLGGAGRRLEVQLIQAEFGSGARTTTRRRCSRRRRGVLLRHE